LLSKLRNRLTAAHLIAVIALFFAVGGPSFAADAVSHAARLITGKQIKDSSITTKDVRNGSLLKKDFKAGQLPAGAQGAQGPQGPKGDPGAKGETGPKGDAGQPATKLWAVVRASDNTIVRGSGAVSVGQQSTAQKLVTFNQRVDNCAYSATIGPSFNGSGGWGSGVPGEVQATAYVSPNVVSVQTYDSAGNFSARDFSVEVFC